MFEITDLGWCEGTGDDVRAIAQFNTPMKSAWSQFYAHESLFIDIGLIDTAVLDNQFSQLLNRRFCPTVDLTSLSASTKKIRGDCAYVNRKSLEELAPWSFSSLRISNLRVLYL